MAVSQPPQPQSRKQLRRQRNSPSPLTEDNAFQTNTQTITKTSAPSLLISQPSMATPTRLLVCSIGNPAPYLNTFHSAGHTVLNALANQHFYPSFHKLRAYGNGLISVGSQYTLWQSPSLMNVSGPSVAAAWRQFQKETRGEEIKLVIVHDELELALGQVKVKTGNSSAKGHNGLKSINSVMRGIGGVQYARICVGIGRPTSREPNVVADYVLRKMSAGERGKVEGCVGRVDEELRRLSGA